MKQTPQEKIFSTCRSGEFIGRKAELDRLLPHADAKTDSVGLALLAAPAAGSSELLRQVYDQLFARNNGVIPFYFEIRASDGTLRNMALRFVREFLLQTVAYRRGDTKILDSSPEIHEIAELAVPADGYWIDRLIETFHGESKLDDDRSFVRNCLSAPLRASGHGARSFVMIDGLHIAAQMPGGETIIDDLKDIFARATIPFVFAGLRRFLFARLPYESMLIEHLPFSDAGQLVENLAAKTGVRVNEQTRDLIAVQLGGNASHISQLFAAANEKAAPLDSFERVQKVYTDDIFGGRIGRQFDATFDRTCPDPELQVRILRLLSESLRYSDGRIPLAYWKKNTGLNDIELEALLDRMNTEEIVNMESGAVRFDALDSVLGDYVAGRARLDLNGETRALVVGETLAANVKRSPVLMARRYRRGSVIGLRDVMQAFAGRHVSTAMIDYSRFKAELKGADDDKIQRAFKEDPAKTALPHIFYTAHTSAFYPKLTEFADTERSAVALGCTAGAEKDEVVWIAAEIDSKLEATREVAEFWCDRLEMVAAHCDFSNVRLWLVAPEGFAPDAMEVLTSRNAYGSSRKQAEMLARLLNASVSPTAATAAAEYEIVVPMGDAAEMIAARAVEDIAKRHGIPAKAINQIKTALVEACINAAEHSLSPDRKINLKFSVTSEKMVITITNRGVRLSDARAAAAGATANDSTRRGWGLKLMKGLMDEVSINETDDGTRITLVKYISQN